ncbi:alanine dehydrogenase [Brevibacillus reuszeri]|uniref:Alanine dehydrogenase n=1 Tax=Brevibacillus reuszeri TaxID=54915 RepID=A0A0K9YR05_9BACL|nr:alanine dehydrogenase [Brevibacillus reuszeri]KNB71158.1 alanine dehydrogenase [Brevibacillus reuszeri]MED1857588.1 alanine dehydrogenase [Brevibacillus reuszeri]GED66579.1 alanine dehydrogenase [Brevibacillus reuszeri]
MIIGVPKEIKNNENRVGLTPAGVSSYKQAGHRVLVESSAGLGSGFGNEDYVAAGAEILQTAAEVWSQADMICKVKEPLPAEYPYFRENQILFTYLHLAPEKELTEQLIAKKVVAIAYETIQMDDGSLPLLIPMSEVAGRMSVQIGAQYLQKQEGGKGVLLSGVPGVLPGRVVIVGGGIVGTNAAKMAVGLGANVTLLDINANRLRELDDMFAGRLQTLISNHYNIAEAVRQADLLIGAVLIPGARAPRLVTEEMVKTMSAGSVIVDVAIDQGGSIETVDRITTHSDPTYVKHGVVHYSVANMPGAVPRTSTIALSNVTLPYGLLLAGKGYRAAISHHRALARGVNVLNGHIVYEAVAKSLQLPYTPLDDIMQDLPF